MRSLFILVLLGFFVAVNHGRPLQSQEDNENQEEIEYEGEGDNGSTAEDTLDESRFGDEDSNGQELDQNQRLTELNRNNYLQKNVAEDEVPQSNPDTPDYKPMRGRDARNDKFNEAGELQAYGKRRRYIENNGANDHLEMPQHLNNRDIKNFKANRIHNNMILDSPLNKRALELNKARNEDGEMLFENNHDQTSKIDKSDYNLNEPLDNPRSTYPKQYLNQMPSENRAMLDANSRNNPYLYYNSRDRREAMKSNKEEAENLSEIESNNESLDKSENESEEMAIKRHIKKMTGDELEQLLNSLSEDKRALLKKIIDDVDVSEKTYDTINKREITKKAGAVGDNAYIESGQSESSKIDSRSSSVDIDTTSFPSSQNAGPTGVTKQTDSQQDTTVLTNQKPMSSDSKVDLKIANENNPENSEALVSNKNQAETENEEIKSKNEIKREAGADATALPKIDDEYNKAAKDDESYFFPQNEDLSQFLDDVEQSRSFDSSKIYKREVESQSELNSKLKSLEESFPNSDAYEEFGGYSGPLIRVKRKNAESAIKKRSAAVLPDAKVGFCPYKSDSSDDDTDEGNEFDDDGFYDPSPNFVSSDNKNLDSYSQQAGRDASSCKLNIVDQSKLPVNDASGEKMNLGSDTDNVLSGVEGVDENLMFNSGTRNRRKTEGNLVEHVDGSNLIQSAQGGARDVETKSTASDDINVPNYQDNDSFGGFPRSYEGDLGRYKRIRRVKQSHVSDAPSNA